MKKLSRSMLILLFVFSMAGVSYATPNKNPAATPTPIEASEANILLLRLTEINEMDKSELNSVEKRELRKEVKSIKKTLNSGVYLSAGAIIIIILLLIILL